MESHQSCEKLVAAEAGLVPPNLVNNVPFFRAPRRNGSPFKLTNCLLVSVFAVLLVLISYEIWQTVRREQLIREFEVEHAPIPVEQLSSASEVTEIPDIRDMAEEVRRLQNRLKEMQEIHNQDTYPMTTELPTSTSSDPKVDELAQDEYELLRNLIQESATESPRPFSVNELLADTVFSTHRIIDEDSIQDSSDSDSSESRVIADPLNETESNFRWAISFHFGEESGERNTSEESNITESEESEIPIPIETEITSSDQGSWGILVPKSFLDPFGTFRWTWGYGRSDETDSESSESGEKYEEEENSVEDKTDSESSESEEKYEEEESSVEIHTAEPPDETTVAQSAELYSDYYEDYDNSYEDDPNWWESFVSEQESESEQSTEDSPEDMILNNTTTESNLFSIADEYEDEVQDPVTTEAPVTSTSTSSDPKVDELAQDVKYELLKELIQESATKRPRPVSIDDLINTVFSTHGITKEDVIQFSTSPTTESYLQNELEELDDSYRLGSPTNQLQQLSSLGATPRGEDVTTMPSPSAESLGDSSSQDDSSLTYASADDYLMELYKRRLSEAESMRQQYLKIEENSEPAPLFDDADLEPIDDWSYISKRSVDTQSTIDTSVRQLTAKELEHKLSLLLQEIDNDNHLLQNEVSLSPEPARNVLQTKLNNFYTKMDAVSAHIDRLHERYVRLNKLDDDYVSRELPSEASDGPENSNY